MDRIRRRVAAVSRRFPSETAVFSRPVLDDFSQPTGEQISLGSVECWRLVGAHPGAQSARWTVDQPGQMYADDGSLWVSVMWRADLPEWQHGDVCVLSDGVERYVRNILNRGNIRVFLQLSEV